MSAIDAEAERIYDQLGRGEQTDVKTIRAALLAAEKRGKEEAAKIAEADGRRELSWAEMSLPVSPGPIIAKDRAGVATRIAAAIRGS